MKSKRGSPSKDIKVDDFNFDQFQPQGAISIPVSRKCFISEMTKELKAYNEKVGGKPTMKLSDLALLREDDFGRLKPVILPECKISLEQGMVYARSEGAIEPVVLFPVASPALTVFNHFNGNTTISEVNEILRKNVDWADDKVHAYTRGLFLKLVSMRVCAPG